MESLALHVIGLDWSGGKVSLFLEDWELARVAFHCHVALDMLCQEMHEAWLLGRRCEQSPLSQQAFAFLSPWTDCDGTERVVVRENKRNKREGERQAEVLKEELRVSSLRFVSLLLCVNRPV